MRSLFSVAVALLIGIAAIGFYRGWFGFSADSAEHNSSATITVDQDKIHADEAKVQDFGHEAKERFGPKAERVK